MMKRLLAIVLCIGMLIPFGANMGLAAIAAESSGYVVHDLDIVIDTTITVEALGGDVLGVSASSFSVNLKEKGWDTGNLALEMDVKLEGETSNPLVAALTGTDAVRTQYIDGQLEMTSSGECDKNEGNFSADKIKWSVGEWSRVQLKLTDLQDAATFDPTNWNFFRWYMQMKGNEALVGQSAKVKVCHVRVVDTSKTPSDAEKVLGNDPVASGDYVVQDLGITVDSKQTVTALGGDFFVTGSTAFESGAVNLKEKGWDTGKLALEMDVKLEGETSNPLVALLTGDDAARQAGIGGQIEFTSSGECDTNEGHFMSYQVKWSVGEWSRVRLMLDSTTFQNESNFDPSNWNFFRWHIQISGSSDLAGKNCQFKLCNVRVVDTAKTPSDEEKTVGNDPVSSEGYVIAELPYQVNVLTTLSNGGECLSQALKLDTAIDLQQYVDAGSKLAVSFDVRLGGDDEAMDYIVSGQKAEGSIELTSSGTCDNQEISAKHTALNFEKGQWTRTVIPFSAFTGRYGGTFNYANFNYLRIYIICRNAAMEGKSIQFGICNVRIVDMNKKAPTAEEFPVGDGSFSAEDPSYFEVKTPNGFYSSETVVAGYNARDYVEKVLKQDPDTVDNWSPIFQSLANGLAAKGGGVVYIPSGHYKCTTNFMLPAGVTLYGDWVNPDDHPEITGTVLDVYYGKDAADSSAFIAMSNSSKLQNLAFWYPEQSASNITPYAYTISMQQYTRVDNVTLVNAYNGIVNRVTANSPSVSDVYGTPLNSGIDIGMVVDICRVNRVRFAPDYWEKSGLDNAPTTDEAKGKLETHLRGYATAIAYRKVDWSYVNFCHVTGYNIGFAMLTSNYTDASTGNEVSHWINGQIYGNLFEDCAIALYCEGTNDQGEGIVDTEIRGCDYGLYVSSVSNELAQNVQLNNVKIDASVATVLVSGKGLMIVTLDGCTLSGAPIQLSMGMLNANNNTFTMEDTEDGPQILVNAGTTGLTLAGNKDKNGDPIAVYNPSQVPVEKSDDTVETVAAVTATEAETATQTKKPTGSAVKVAEGLDNTGKTDVTAALQAQLDSLKTSGGLLYLPAGHYRLDGSITVPSGVELRGALAVGHVPFNVGTILDVYGGKDDDNASATVILKEKAGIRGITFNWPEQYADGKFHTYPYAMQGQGSDIYVIHTSLRNAWKGLDLFSYRCDNHYVEYLSGTSLAGGIHVGGGSQNGKLIDCHFNYNAMLNSDIWGWGALPTGLTRAQWEDICQHQIQHNAVAYRLGDVKDELLFGCFTYSGASGLQLIEENGKAASARVFSHGVDFGNVSIDVQAVEKLDVVSTQLTAFDLLPKEGDLTLKDDCYHIRLGEKVTGSVNVRSCTMWGSSPTNAISVQGGTLNINTVVIYHTDVPFMKVSETGKVNMVSFVSKETQNAKLLADGSVGQNVSVKQGVVLYTMTDSDKVGKYEGVITRQTRWDVPDDTEAFGDDSKVLFSEGFTDYSNLSEEAQIFRQKNISGMASGSIARSGRMTLTVVAQESSTLILTEAMEIPQGKADSLYRLESRLNLSSMRAGSSINLSAYNNENDILNLAVFAADGTLTTYDGKTVGSFATDQWYRLAIELDLRDTAHKTMRVYLYDDEYKQIACSAVITLPEWFQGEYQLNRLQWGVENANLSSDAAETDDTVLILDYVLATYSTKTTFGILGDVDGDGKITSTDARLALQCYAGKISADKLNTAMGDVDGDGKITSTDARLILQRYVGKISQFPVE